MLVIDLFPPSKRDPQGIHKLIWDEFQEEDLELPADKRLTLAAYKVVYPARRFPRRWFAIVLSDCWLSGRMNEAPTGCSSVWKS